MTSRPSTAAPILAMLAVVLVTLAAYVGGYFWLGVGYSVTATLHVGSDYLEQVRFRRKYPNRALPIVFWPLSKGESVLRGQEVELRFEE